MATLRQVITTVKVVDYAYDHYGYLLCGPCIRAGYGRGALSTDSLPVGEWMRGYVVDPTSDRCDYCHTSASAFPPRDIEVVETIEYIQCKVF